MKYIKSYENSNSTPQIDEYVICSVNHTNANPDYAKQINDFISNNIGKILEIDNIHGPNYEIYYHVYYQNVPKEISRAFGWNKNGIFNHYLNISQNQIICHSTNIKNLEQKIVNSKYNL